MELLKKPNKCAILYLNNKRKVNNIMKQNKLSVWSIIILVVTVISLILLVFSIVSTAIAMPTVMAAARQAAAGEEEAAVNLAVNIAMGAVIAAVVSPQSSLSYKSLEDSYSLLKENGASSVLLLRF